MELSAEELLCEDVEEEAREEEDTDEDERALRLLDSLLARATLARLRGRDEVLASALVDDTAREAAAQTSNAYSRAVIMHTNA
jgi:hypothetical protein